MNTIVNDFISKLEKTKVISRQDVINFEHMVGDDVITKELHINTFTSFPTNTNTNKVLDILKGRNYTVPEPTEVDPISLIYYFHETKHRLLWGTYSVFDNHFPKCKKLTEEFIREKMPLYQKEFRRCFNSSREDGDDNGREVVTAFKKLLNSYNPVEYNEESGLFVKRETGDLNIIDVFKDMDLDKAIEDFPVLENRINNIREAIASEAENRKLTFSRHSNTNMLSNIAGFNAAIELLSNTTETPYVELCNKDDFMFSMQTVIELYNLTLQKLEAGITLNDMIMYFNNVEKLLVYTEGDVVFFNFIYLNRIIDRLFNDIGCTPFSAATFYLQHGEVIDVFKDSLINICNKFNND